MPMWPQNNQNHFNQTFLKCACGHNESKIFSRGFLKPSLYDTKTLSRPLIGFLEIFTTSSPCYMFLAHCWV